jgi:hypothetical protein
VTHRESREGFFSQRDLSKGEEGLSPRYLIIPKEKEEARQIWSKDRFGK